MTALWSQRRTTAMLNIIGIIISGALIGILARFFYPGEVPMGWIMTIVLGIAGSLLAGLVTARGTGGIGGGVNRAGCLASVVGEVVLIFIGRVLGWG
jgi:uncharacterized membrane protein YeaQ/YmgE (transglycosylase-associated protein family)